MWLFFEVFESDAKIRLQRGFKNNLSVNGGITPANCRFDQCHDAISGRTFRR